MVVAVFLNSKMQQLKVIILSSWINTCFSRAVRLMMGICFTITSADVNRIVAVLKTMFEFASKKEA